MRTQLPLKFSEANSIQQPPIIDTYKDKLLNLLSGDLDFHDQNNTTTLHNFHSFPAKFPPQLPGICIQALTDPYDRVLDPMAGSGTTVLEAFLSGRQGIGFDIDPLALLITRVKTTPLDAAELIKTGNKIFNAAMAEVKHKRSELMDVGIKNWDKKTRDFIDYWFLPETQIELLALREQIEQIKNPTIKDFFDLAFSATIITKSGGVSLAFDLGHTRPHRAKVVIVNGNRIETAKNLAKFSPKRIEILTKHIRSSFDEFNKKYKQNLKGIIGKLSGFIPPDIRLADAQAMPLEDNSIDLIVTSPPYASNAIDYMRAHKFSLIWMGYPIHGLGKKRGEYIGGEATKDFDFEKLPDYTAKIVADLCKTDLKRGQVLHRYYSEMTRVLREMFRVLRPGRSAIVVVGSSTLKGKDTQTGNCLADIGQTIGFEVPKIGIRNLHRDKRMMPAGKKLDLDSQIQQRMHQEFVIGFYKPEWYSYSAHLEKHVIRTRFREVSNSPKTKVLFKTIQDRWS
jgi:DNA modification methylase